MSIKRLLASTFVAATVASAVVAAPTTADATTPLGSGQPSLPQVSSAQAGAQWLASQLTSQGYIPSAENPGTADLSATANTIFALAIAGVDPSGVQTALSYTEANVDAYVTVDGSDGPAQLALLILDAHALGATPTSFGGTDLVARLLATQQTTGPDLGLFGTEDQVNDFSAGVYQQGLALSALAAVGDTQGGQIAEAETWLHGQQCPDGGWTSYESSSNPCNGSPADFEGPDTNSTSLAIQGLSAEQSLSKKQAKKAMAFLVTAQDSDGGWGYEPNAPSAPGSTDPDSTALVTQALLALGKSGIQTELDRQSANPVAALESFQIGSGPGAGAFTYPGISGPNILATYQAVPAVAAIQFPLVLHVTTESLPGGSPGVKYSADLTASGGTAPYSWFVATGSGSLPPGLKLKKSGAIVGRPTSTGSYSFTVVASDSKTASPLHALSVAWKVLTIST